MGLMLGPFNLQTLKYQLLLMPGISNMKIVNIIPNAIKSRAFSTALGKSFKCGGLLWLKEHRERGRPEVCEAGKAEWKRMKTKEQFCL